MYVVVTGKHTKYETQCTSSAWKGVADVRGGVLEDVRVSAVRARSLSLSLSHARSRTRPVSLAAGTIRTVNRLKQLRQLCVQQLATIDSKHNNTNKAKERELTQKALHNRHQLLPRVQLHPRHHGFPHHTDYDKR